MADKIIPGFSLTADDIACSFIKTFVESQAKTSNIQEPDLYLSIVETCMANLSSYVIQNGLINNGQIDLDSVSYLTKDFFEQSDRAREGLDIAMKRFNKGEKSTTRTNGNTNN